MALAKWDVHFIHCQQTYPPKLKYVILAHLEDDWFYGLFINSLVHLFVQSKPKLLPCMASIPVATHPFLRHDSWVDCTDTYYFKQVDAENNVGCIHVDMVPAIQAAVKACPKLLPNQKRRILS